MAKIELPVSDSALLAECDVQTFKSTGPGGQGVNTTDSAVRIRHRPSGVVVTCRRQRSQHMNKVECLRRLRDRVEALGREAPERVPTRVSEAARRRRLDEKALQAAKKRARERPAEDE
jgi:protein subunit release factor B